MELVELALRYLGYGLKATAFACTEKLFGIFASKTQDHARVISSALTVKQVIPQATNVKCDGCVEIRKQFRTHTCIHNMRIALTAGLRYIPSMSLSTADILPCACGRTPQTEAYRPAGRVHDLHRVACECGVAAPHWSVCEASAIRLWNSIISTGEVPDEDEYSRLTAG
jgi:hypothetical protein